MTKQKIIVTFCCFIQIIAVAGTAVAVTAAAATKGVVMKTLSTGQKIIISEDKSLPVTHIYAVLKSGSIWDPPEIEGITDLMGDMLMRGTQTRTREDRKSV